MTDKGRMTPGPWHVNAVDTKRGRIVGDETAAPGTYEKLTINNHNATVATVYRPRDARAIACLPELVEAARLLVEEYHGHERAHDDGCLPCRMNRVLARIDGEEA